MGKTVGVIDGRMVLVAVGAIKTVVVGVFVPENAGVAVESSSITATADSTAGVGEPVAKGLVPQLCSRTRRMIHVHNFKFLSAFLLIAAPFCQTKDQTISEIYSRNTKGAKRTEGRISLLFFPPFSAVKSSFFLKNLRVFLCDLRAFVVSPPSCSRWRTSVLPSGTAQRPPQPPARPPPPLPVPARARLYRSALRRGRW